MSGRREGRGLARGSQQGRGGVSEQDRGRGRGRGRGRSSQQGRGRQEARGHGEGRGRGRQQRATATNKNVVPWKNGCAAKEKLRSLLMDPSSYVHNKAVDEIHNDDPIFKQYPLRNFKTNFRNLKNSIDVERAAIQFDQLSLEADRNKYPRNGTTDRGYPFWDTHPARKLLEDSVRKGQANNVKPQEIRSSETAYKDFPPRVFAKHVHQEKAKQTQEVYWQQKRNKKGRKKHEVEAVALKDS